MGADAQAKLGELVGGFGEQVDQGDGVGSAQLAATGVQGSDIERGGQVEMRVVQAVEGFEMPATGPAIQVDEAKGGVDLSLLYEPGRAGGASYPAGQAAG